MPRTGSNLLSSILNQNEAIHSEGFSAMCRILWNFHYGITDVQTYNEMAAVRKNKEEVAKRIGTSLFDSYYGLSNKVIFDKCTSWTLDNNIDVVKKYVTESPKIIVLTRKIEDVAKSYVNVYLKNGYSQEEAENMALNLNGPGTNPLMRPIAGILYSKVRKDAANFMYVDYDDLVNDTKKTVDSLYTFCDIPAFDHKYTDIELKYPEDETVILKGLMGVRSDIGKRVVDIDLSEKAKNKIKDIEDLLAEAEKSPEDEATVRKAQDFYTYNTN
jgi:hypothetical protein